MGIAIIAALAAFLIVTGVALLSVPAALITAGVGLGATAVLAAYAKGGGNA